jgi:Zn-dependent peptidase ImmA (M78 family)
MKWPQLPLVVYGAGGMIAVLEVGHPKDEDNVGTEGTWEPDSRTISIKADLLPRRKWLIYFHELMHATLADSGLVNLLTDDSQEALCDAVATSRLVELVGTLTTRSR